MAPTGVGRLLLSIAFISIVSNTAFGQFLPSASPGWDRVPERISMPDTLRELRPAERALLSAYGARFVVTGSYSRGREVVSVFLAELETRERAFGLYAASAAKLRRHGIVGDAFALDRNTMHLNYGPYYVLFRHSMPGREAPDDLVRRVKRQLFNRADCYGSDVPLPWEERIPGTEHYYPPDVRAWASERGEWLQPVLDVVETRAAWVARYASGEGSGGRVVYSFFMRQEQARANFESTLIERYATDARSRDLHCGAASFFYKSWIVLVVRGKERVTLVIADMSDALSCTWIRLFRQM